MSYQGEEKGRVEGKEMEGGREGGKEREGGGWIKNLKSLR